MSKENEEFSAAELKEARERLTKERESSVIVSRADRLAAAVGMAGAVGGGDTETAPAGVRKVGGR